jgi:hypothetical protein
MGTRGNHGAWMTNASGAGGSQGPAYTHPGLIHGEAPALHDALTAGMAKGHPGTGDSATNNLPNKPEGNLKDIYSILWPWDVLKRLTTCRSRSSC